jgi:hypothetical protein
LTWFPLQPGSRWVYEHDWKSGDRNRPEADRWTTEETITSSVSIPEGRVVVRAVKTVGAPDRHIISERVALPNGEVREVQRSSDTHTAYPVTRGWAPYLVHGNCVYVIADGWDGQQHELRPNYRMDLAQCTLSPDFCFPLETGRA